MRRRRTLAPRRPGEHRHRLAQIGLDLQQAGAFGGRPEAGEKRRIGRIGRGGRAGGLLFLLGGGALAVVAAHLLVQVRGRRIDRGERFDRSERGREPRQRTRVEALEAPVRERPVGIGVAAS